MIWQKEGSQCGSGCVGFFFFFFFCVYEAADNVSTCCELHCLLSKSVLLLPCNSSCDKFLAACKLLEKVPNKTGKLTKLQTSL